MKKDKLIMKNNREIELETGSDLHALRVKSQDKQTMIGVWEQMTKENLTEVQIQNGAGLTVGRYENLVLTYPILVSDEADGIISTYCLREKTEEEKRMEAMEQTLEMHEEAILDMAAVTSAIAEQVEKGES